MDCLNCGHDYEEVTEPVSLRVQGRRVLVDRTFFRCPACGDSLATLEQTAELQRRAGAAIRQKEGLLQPEEITAIRESLNLTKADFERLLNSGEKTAVRWEKGTVFQSQHANELMLALRDVPAFAEYLANRRGLKIRLPLIVDYEANRAAAFTFRSYPIAVESTRVRVQERETTIIHWSEPGFDGGDWHA